MDIVTARAVAMVAAALHHKVFTGTANMSGFDFRPAAENTVVDTAKVFTSFIVHGRQ